MRRTSRHKDKTHEPLSDWLRAHGWTVYDVNTIGGFVDAIAVLGGRVVFIEFKTGRKRPQPHQEALHAHLRAAGAEVAVISSEADCQEYFLRPFSGYYDVKQMRKQA